MEERVEVKLRQSAWEQMRKLLLRKEDMASALGDGGMDLVNRFLGMVKNIQRILGVAEYELDVPGAVLHQEFQDVVTRWLSRLNSFLNEGLERQYSKDVALDILEASSFINWMNSGRPLVTVKDMSGGGSNDKEEIVRMLVESNDDHQLSVFPIVGIPGTEKTTLAQHIYHDTRVYGKFSVRHWVSMSETHTIRSKLLDQVFRCQTSDNDILSEFHSLVDGTRYLLILDDVTHVVPGMILHDLLRNVGQGSKIILTASSTTVLEKLAPLPVVNGVPYELGGLSKHEALSLFKSIAFREGDEQRNRVLYDIGLKVCDRYASSSLLVKNIAALLSSKDTVEESDYGPIESLLIKLNLGRYKELSSNIQQCVNFCALFPPDYKFSKADLVHLWTAQEWLTGGRRIEEVVGDECFGELQNDGYFFEDSESDSNGAGVSYKMHNLVNEFIKDVAKGKFHLVDKPTENIDWKTVLHLSFTVGSSWIVPSELFDAKQVLSLLFLPIRSCNFATVQNLGRIFSSLKLVRALDLVAVNCESLPDSLGELQDLKYLRLGCSSESLPNCVSNLQKLQTLDLGHSKVRELPNDFCKLINLRHFYTGDRLDDMPPSFGELKSLQTLHVFIEGQNNGLDALTHLNHLIGKLKIRYKKHQASDVLRDVKGVLKDKYLTDLTFIWSSSYGEPAPDGSDFLQLPPTLRNLAVCHWKGETFPHWVMDEFSNLHSLVSVHIEDCNRCRCLPAFSTLPRLKSLELWGLHALKYIETSDDDITAASAAAAAAYFPSLECLMLANLPGLKAWSNENYQNSQQPVFPRLSVLKISGCPKLMSMPLAPRMESLEAENIHGKLLKFLLSVHELPVSVLTPSVPTSTLKELQITSIHELDSFLVNQSALESLKIRRCPQLQTLIVEHPTSLQLLEIHESARMINIIGALEHLSIDWKLGVVKSCTRGI